METMAGEGRKGIDRICYAYGKRGILLLLIWQERDHRTESLSVNFTACHRERDQMNRTHTGKQIFTGSLIGISSPTRYLSGDKRKVN